MSHFETYRQIYLIIIDVMRQISYCERSYICHKVEGMGEKAYKTKAAKEKGPLLDLLNLVAEILVEQDAKQSKAASSGKESRESVQDKDSDVQE